VSKKNRLDVIRINPPGRARSRRLPPFGGATTVFSCRQLRLVKELV
jgi:hypothetical protein